MKTIQDVAKKAGVAKSTVSYYLNNTKKLKKETEERIEKAIKELNYNPRHVARSLRTKQSLTIGIIVPEISNYFFTEIIRGIEETAYKSGFSIILCNTNEDAVSYYLNNTKKEKETEERIEKAIKELNYNPRHVARSLRTKQSLTIGIIVPEISNYFFTEIIRGIEETAYKSGFSIILCNTNEDAEKERRYLEVLFSKDIDGLVFISTGMNQNILSKYDELPIIVVDRKVGNINSMVLVDNVEGGYIATKFLLEEKGYPIHYLSGPLTISTYFDRLNGYMKALKEKNYDYNESFINQCDLSIISGYETMINIIDREPNVKAVFAANDILAIGALKALLSKGKKVGDEIFLMGYDDIDTAAMVTPALSTVAQPKYTMGVTAAELLIEQIKGKTQLNKRIVLKPELIIRESAK